MDITSLRWLLLVGPCLMEGIVTLTSADNKPVNFDVDFTRNAESYLNYTGIPDLRSFTICFWMKQKPPQGSPGFWVHTILSYANQVQALQIDIIGGVKSGAVFYHMGKYIDYPQFNPKDKQWHHLCFTWNNQKGFLKSYVDGNKVSEKQEQEHAKKEQIIKGGGCLVIGSSQLTPCGSALNEGKSFTGKLSQINIWNRVLDEYDVTKLYRTCDVYLGDVLPWKRSLVDKYVGGNNVTSPSEACQSNYNFGTFMVYPDTMLTGHVIQQVMARNEMECVHACLHHYQCRSTNFFKGKEFENCELNNSDMTKDPVGYTKVNGIVYCALVDAL